MTVTHADQIEVRQAVGPDVTEITDAIQAIVDRSGVRTGQVSVCVVGSTGSITTIEYEPGVVQDLVDAVNRMAPPGLDYAHEQAWHDGNGHSHVQAALIGPSITVAVRNGRLGLGTWQQIVAVNHDNKARKRVLEITVIGEAG